MLDPVDRPHALRRDGGARHRSSAQARRLHRPVAARAHGTTRRTRPPSTRCPTSTSVRASGSPWRDVLEVLCAGARRTRPSCKADLHQARHDLRRQDQRRRGRRARVPARPRARSRTTVARRSSSSAATSRSRPGTSSKSSTRESEKWDELIRLIERSRDQGDAATARSISLLFRAARLWETRRRSPTAPRAPTRRCSRSTPDNLHAAEALSPIYEAANDAKQARGASTRSACATWWIPTSASPCCARRVCSTKSA
jgi:hypothetical protein